MLEPGKGVKQVRLTRLDPRLAAAIDNPDGIRVICCGSRQAGKRGWLDEITIIVADDDATRAALQNLDVLFTEGIGRPPVGEFGLSVLQKHAGLDVTDQRERTCPRLMLLKAPGDVLQILGEVHHASPRFSRDLRKGRVLRHRKYLKFVGENRT